MIGIVTKTREHMLRTAENMAAQGIRPTGLYVGQTWLHILLGLPSVLPKDLKGEYAWGEFRFRLLSAEEAAERSGHMRRPHRLMQYCMICGDLVPAGRIHQHVCTSVYR